MRGGMLQLTGNLVTLWAQRNKRCPPWSKLETGEVIKSHGYGCLTTAIRLCRLGQVRQVSKQGPSDATVSYVWVWKEVGSGKEGNSLEFLSVYAVIENHLSLCRGGMTDSERIDNFLPFVNRVFCRTKPASVQGWGLYKLCPRPSNENDGWEACKR